jgi:hypothetical protein
MGRMGCTSRLVRRSAFLGSQTVMPGRADAASVDAIDRHAMVAPADRRS